MVEARNPATDGAPCQGTNDTYALPRLRLRGTDGCLRVLQLRNDNAQVSSRIDVEAKQEEKLKAQVEDNADMPTVRRVCHGCSKRAAADTTAGPCVQVLDYVNQKAQMFELEKEVASWKRKVEIASLSRR